MFTRPAIQVAEQTEVKVCTLGAPHMSIPDRGTAEVASGNCPGLDWYKSDRRDGLRLQGLVVHHLAKQT